MITRTLTYDSALGTLQACFDAFGEKASSVHSSLLGLEACYILPGGAIYTVSDLDLDTDGPKIPGVSYESTHQNQTSLRWPDDSSIRSDLTPFVVIPGGWDKNIRLGDVGLVLYNNKVCRVIVGDFGPRKKFGEGSIALHAALGFNRIKNNKIVDVGIDGGVRMVLFPRSGNGHCRTNEEIYSLVNAEWDKLAVLSGASAGQTSDQDKPTTLEV